MTSASEPNAAADPAPRDRLRRLVSAACDGPLTSAEQAEVERLVASDTALVHDYAEFVATETLVERSLGLSVFDRGSTLPAGTPAATTAPPPTPRPQATAKRVGPRGESPLRGVLRRPLSTYAVAASLVGVALAATMVLDAPPLATVVAVDHATRADDSEIAVGDTDLTEWVDLATGSVNLSLRRGTLVAIDAPARFRVTSGNDLEVERGALSAQVPEAAHGFAVATLLGGIVDLGTGFRAVVSPERGLVLHVTQGAVQLNPRGGGPVAFSAGDVASVDPQGTTRVGALNAPQCSGAMTFSKEHPTSLGMNAFDHDGAAYVFLESLAVRLSHDLPTDLSNPGKHVDLEGHGDVALAGANVDSYLIHYAPASSRHTVRGSVRFPGKIVGVIGGDERLNATNGTLGARWTLACQHPERGVESAPDPNADTIVLSRDRRTLSAVFQTESIDQVRVLVESR
ncbi:MAG: hypothetical protein ACRCT8_11750 [Lacipirellulaceae bacterium]